MEINLNQHLRQQGLFAKYHFQDIIYTSPTMEQVILIAKQAAVTDHTVLIRGESGTGKELLAQSIHNYSHRSDRPFVAINCNTLPESLLESQLFGYEGGSFTGARKEGKSGLFEQANQGTIFLDEIGDISPNLQSQLLRVLQERQIMRIGGSKVIDLDVRIIAATNQNLEKLVADGKFRSDLFYRLNIIPMEVPPLRQRKEDILPLLSVFLGSLYAEVTEDEKKSICQYQWPGNVRQLEGAAKYYETLHAFPKYLYAEDADPQQDTAASALPLQPVQPGKQTSPNLSRQALIHCVLSMIAASTEAFHGIGRKAIMSRLKEQQIKVSDGKPREILFYFEAEDLITIERGRGGCRITEKGLAYLDHTL